MQNSGGDVRIEERIGGGTDDGRKWRMKDRGESGGKKRQSFRVEEKHMES